MKHYYFQKKKKKTFCTLALTLDSLVWSKLPPTLRPSTSTVTVRCLSRNQDPGMLQTSSPFRYVWNGRRLENPNTLQCCKSWGSYSIHSRLSNAGLVSGGVRVTRFGLGSTNQLFSQGGILGQGGGGGRVTADSVVAGSAPVETGGQPWASWLCSTKPIWLCAYRSLSQASMLV